MLITTPPERTPAGSQPGERRRWRVAPATLRAAALPAGPASFGPPAPDPVACALQADARHAGREAVLGVALAALVLLAVATGWFWPVLALGFVAAPFLGVGLESWDAYRDGRHGRQPRQPG